MAQLEGLLDLSKFAVRIERRDMPRLVETLRAIPAERVAAMQAELAKVWERYTYSGLFKREYLLQDSPPDAATAARVGVLPKRRVHGRRSHTPAGRAAASYRLLDPKPPPLVLRSAGKP